jgi:hypothetical protein
MKNKMLGPIAAALLTATAVTAPAHAAKWYWVPSRITNGSEGRTLLTSTPGGLIGTLLGSLGQYWSHSGMFIDAGYNIRHNTADPNKIKIVNDSIGLPHHLNGATLLSMQPGLITQRTDVAFGASGPPEFNFFDYDDSTGLQTNRNAAVLLRRNTASIGGSIYYTGAARKMVEYEAYYSLYSFTDIWTTEPDPTDPSHIHVAADLNRKNMCSGTIAWALFSGGGFDTWPLHYTAEIRDGAAPILYQLVYSALGKKVPGTNIPFLGSILLALVSGTRERIANQVVNCMAFNDCYNTGSRWRNGVGAGDSLSPDNLTPVGFVNPHGVAWGISGWDPGNTWTQWYDSVEPVTYSGGFWKKY